MPCSWVWALAWASSKRFHRIACWAASSPRSSTSLDSQKPGEPLPLLADERLGSVVDGPIERAEHRSASSSGGTPRDVW